MGMPCLLMEGALVPISFNSMEGTAGNTAWSVDRNDEGNGFDRKAKSVSKVFNGLVSLKHSWQVLAACSFTIYGPSRQQRNGPSGRTLILCTGETVRTAGTAVPGCNGCVITEAGFLFQ